MEEPDQRSYAVYLRWLRKSSGKGSDIYGKFVLEQFEMFDKNIDWYMDNWKDNFSDYINDLMRIAVSDIERKKLTDIYEEMRKIMKESSKKRG